MLQVTDVRQTRVFKDAHEEGFEEGQEVGLEKGRVEGREEGLLRVAQKLLDQGLSVGMIAEATGFSQAQIRKLSKKPRK